MWAEPALVRVAAPGHEVAHGDALRRDRLLREHAEARGHRSGGKAVDVGAVEHHAAGAGLQEPGQAAQQCRSEEHTSELQSLMRISYAVFCLKKKKKKREEIREEQETTIQKQKEQNSTEKKTKTQTQVITKQVKHKHTQIRNTTHNTSSIIDSIPYKRQ